MIEPGNTLRWADHPETATEAAHTRVYFNNNDSIREQFLVLMLALKVYDQRNAKYKDNWRRMGWRGVLIRIRERAERLWDDFWDAAPLGDERLDHDDALDLINFAAFMIRALNGETTRDGSWW